MKPTNFYLYLALHATLASSLLQHQMKRRQDEDSSSVDPAVAYLFKMCSPDTYNHIYGNNTGGDLFPNLSHSSAPCEQRDYIMGSCVANSTVAEVDFAAEQQCLCGSNFWEAWLGCDACYRAHGYPLLDSEEEGTSWASSISTAECTPSPFPSVPFRNLLTIYTQSSRAPRITLTNDMFPNQTAVSNYWTKNASPTAVLGSITGIATGRATEWTADSWGIYTPSGSLSSSLGTASITRSPTASGSGSASGSAASVSTTLSTAGVGDLTVERGIVLVIVNVVAVMLL
ncbi:hypothetical protein BKA65DRAFT_485796 [Rhexocercosporidium sp. MPI-PUGE-AT-0058]|nr:hypothetical protein BKA65DRAFT_485796 [Rhexocercosporidium sp. MPI-PUGE-AT-0058]